MLAKGVYWIGAHLTPEIASCCLPSPPLPCLSGAERLLGASTSIALCENHVIVTAIQWLRCEMLFLGVEDEDSNASAFPWGMPFWNPIFGYPGEIVHFWNLLQSVRGMGMQMQMQWSAGMGKSESRKIQFGTFSGSGRARGAASHPSITPWR